MDLREEMSGAEFGDRRLTSRLLKIVDQLSPNPEDSFPTASGGDAALEATYRFLNNAEVTPARIVAPHLVATRARMRAAALVIVAHDTSEFAFEGVRKGLGRLTNKRQGFFGHFALAMRADTREPLGLAGVELFSRAGANKDRATRRHRRHAPHEGRRWWNLAEEVEHSCEGATLLHVMDREADSYTLLSNFAHHGYRYVVRMAHDRCVHSDAPAEAGRRRLGDALLGAPVMLVREVPLSRRVANPRINNANIRHKPREARTAQLEVSARKVQLAKTDYAPKASPATLQVNVVRVREVGSPEGLDPVEWRLVTSEPIDTAAELAAIVDAYRCRWLIEEYFRALKSGCALEKRQLENVASITNAIAVFAPIAWRLLWLRAMSRQAEPCLPTTVLTSLQLRLLHAHPKLQLPASPTVRQAMFAIAKLGGHITNNGDPGWIVLGRGYEKLLLLEQGALLATM